MKEQVNLTQVEGKGAIVDLACPISHGNLCHIMKYGNVMIEVVLDSCNGKGVIEVGN